MNATGKALDFEERPSEYSVTRSVITKDRVAIDWTETDTKCGLVAYSKDDGNVYSGTWSTRDRKSTGTVELTKFRGPNGEIAFFGKWARDDGDSGYLLFRLKA
jgi:hypothetical protein